MEKEIEKTYKKEANEKDAGLYDVFITCKYCDEKGNITEDGKIAKQLTEALTMCNLKVFFTPSNLNYLDYTDEVLDKAKSMVVVLTKAEYAKSKWVQYEWKSFYNAYLDERKKSLNLFVLTKDVDVHDLPLILRNAENFSYHEDLSDICESIKRTLM